MRLRSPDAFICQLTCEPENPRFLPEGPTNNRNWRRLLRTTSASQIPNCSRAEEKALRVTVAGGNPSTWFPLGAFVDPAAWHPEIWGLGI